MKKWWIGIGCVVVLLLLGALKIYSDFETFKQSPIQLNEERMTFIIEPGTTMPRLIEQLNHTEIVPHPLFLKVLVKLHPQYANIKSGIYTLNESMTVESLLTLFISTEGRQPQFTIQFIEGTIAKEWLNVLQNKENIESQIEPLTVERMAELLGVEGSIEGWLAPDTYFYTQGMSDVAILKKAHQQMVNDLEQVWETRDSDLPYQTPYELLIMASIIEKETGIRSERRTVASVFVNRLKKGMKLQTDPTIIYGLGDRYQGTIYKSHLSDKTNPYNTYVIDGLPPTPIAMPSRASLEAAAHPEETSYLYFVATGTGGHTFSQTYQQHLKAVKAYREMERSQTTSPADRGKK